MQIINTNTLRKRAKKERRRHNIERLKNYIAKRHSRNLIKRMRKQYIKDGQKQQELNQYEYRYKLQPALEILKQASLVEYLVLSDGVYKVTIKEQLECGDTKTKQ